MKMLEAYSQLYLAMGRNRNTILLSSVSFFAVFNFFWIVIPSYETTSGRFLAFGYLWMTVPPAAFIYYGPRIVLGVTLYLNSYEPFDGDSRKDAA